MDHEAELQNQELAVSDSTDCKPFSLLFKGAQHVELMYVRCITEWFKHKGPGQLRLPPIQRSLVWRNEQIVNYWDSLMRGYPPGMMMVHHAEKGRDGKIQGRNADDETQEMQQGGFHLFDGQQRLAAILLGFGEGPFHHSRRLWVDLGEPKGAGDRLFQLRINSQGQPYGYRPEAPNTKLKRLEHEKWPNRENSKTLKSPQELFSEFANAGKSLGGSTWAVPLAIILDSLITKGVGHTLEQLMDGARGKGQKLSGELLDGLLNGLEVALNARIVVSMVPDIVLDVNNYARFFGRIGQGGTRLTDDELIYSLIKDRYPKVHDEVKRIVQESGRLVSEVDLVLAALRVAQTDAPAESAKESEKAGRPTPDRVHKLSEGAAKATLAHFESLLIGSDSADASLPTRIKTLRKALQYDIGANPLGLPAMLLARLPRDLVDVLVLLAARCKDPVWDDGGSQTLIAFALYWLIFVGSNDKAAYRVFVASADREWTWDQPAAAALIRDFEKLGIARVAPREECWPALQLQVEKRSHELADWDKRFTAADIGSLPGEALRVVSTHAKLMRRVLLWLQRRYITGSFPSFDPTSTHDDDLPLDFDHLIPYEQFGGHWTEAYGRFDLDADEKDRFRHRRHSIGNSMGNMRWLAASENRARGMSRLTSLVADDAIPAIDDYIEDLEPWNNLIGESSVMSWNQDNIREFQRLIDSRTLELVRTFMKSSGITALLEVADKLDAVPHRDVLS